MCLYVLEHNHVSSDKYNKYKLIEYLIKIGIYMWCDLFVHILNIVTGNRRLLLRATKIIFIKGCFFPHLPNLFVLVFFTK